MVKINDNFLKFPGAYLFAMVRQKSAEFKAKNPAVDVVSLGVGDVTLPLAPAIVDAMEKAVREQAVKETFHGYPPTVGFPFLKEKIIAYDFNRFGVSLELDEMFVNDGAKTDLGAIGDIFSSDNVIAVPDPTYPAYVDANVTYGRCGKYDETIAQWDNVVYLPCTAENNFIPALPAKHADIIYLCFPNNPTGVTISKPELQKWVDYANEHGSIIIYDSAYEGFIETEGVPHTIYECEGAKKCAIEIRSFSKTAGFTGERLGFTVIPFELMVDGVSVNALWKRRQTTKYNGAPYIIQRGAEAIYTPEGMAQTKEQIAYYKRNARYIKDNLNAMGYEAWGGVDSPYVWMRTPKGMASWAFFDILIEKANVLGTPGSGFGPSGEGYFRLTGFGTYEDTKKAIERIRVI